MIKWNKKSNRLSIKFNEDCNISDYNYQLLKFNRNLIIFKHEGVFKIIDPTLGIRNLNKKITIQL